MRHKGSKSHVNLERDKVVPALYHKAKELVEWPASEMAVCRMAASLPVKEFYVGFDSAVEYVRNRYYHQKRKEFQSPYKQQLYDALYEQFLNIVDLPENRNTFITELVLRVLSKPAPCVGLSPLQLYYIMLRHKKKR